MQYNNLYCLVQSMGSRVNFYGSCFVPTLKLCSHLFLFFILIVKIELNKALAKAGSYMLIWLNATAQHFRTNQTNCCFSDSEYVWEGCAPSKQLNIISL